MKKYVIALVALSGLGYINSAKGMEVPAKGTVVLGNKITDLTGNYLPIFLGINGNTQQNVPIKPNSTTSPSGHKGVVTSIIVHTLPIYAFRLPPHSSVQKMKLNTIYWDWNKYRNQIEKRKAAFLKAHPNFPNDVTSITFGRGPAPASAIEFRFTGGTSQANAYFNEPFSINCATGGGSFMIGDCSE